MNKRILLALCLIAASLQGILAQCYVLNDATERNFSTISDYTYNLDGRPAGQLTFDAKRDATGFGNLKVAQYVNGSWSSAIFDQKPGKVTSTFLGIETGIDYVSYGPITLDRNATKIKFYTETGATLKKYFKNVKVTQATYVEPSSNNISCGNVEVLSSSTDTKFSIAWSNAKQLTLTLDNTTDFALSKTSIASLTCAYGTESDIIIDFHPQTKGDKTATVTISDTDNKVWGTVTITGHGDGLPQTISWWDADVTMLSRGDTIGSNESPFVQASSGLALTTLTSSDENVLKIEGGKLIAVAAGTADIIAYQAGTSTFASVRDTLHLEVTNLLTQRITWTQGLNFKWGDAATALTATSSSGLPITYELIDNANNVVTLVGNTINISTSKAGTATIKAVQAGDATYAATSYLRTLRVRDPNASCLNEPWVLDETVERSFSTISDYEYTLDGSPAGTLSFDAKCQDIWLFWGGDLYVKQYVNGEWSGKIATCKFNNKNTYYHFGQIELDRRATKIQLFTEGGATGYKVFKNVQVTRAHFMESNPSSVTIDGQFETTTKKTVKVTYSNIQDVVDVKMASTNAEFSVSPSSFAGNDCGEYGTINVVLSYTPETMDSDKDTIIVSNTKDGEIRIPISTTVQKRAQYISWALRDSLASTQTYTLNKINPVSGLPITYNFSDESILKLDADNKLVFLQVDTVVTITASCAGNDYYLDAENIVKTIRLFKGLPTLTLPVAADTIYFGQILGLVRLEGGCAKDMSDDFVAGSFIWENYLAVPNAGNPVSCAIKFIPEKRDIYGEVFDFVDVVVLKLPQFIEWSMPDSLGILDSITLDAQVASSLKISYQLSGEGAVYASIGSDNELNLIATVEALGKELTITAWQVGNHNYLPSDTVVYTVNIRKTIAEFFAATEPTIYGKNLEDIPIYVDHNVAGTWQYDDTSNPILDVCIYSLSATFTPSNLELCEPSHVKIPVNIIAIPTTIAVVPTAQSIEQGKSLGEATLVGGSVVVAGTTDVVAGTFAWQNSNFIPAIGDNQEFTVVFTPNSTNYAVVTCTVTLNVTQ